MDDSEFNDASLEVFEQELRLVWFFAKDVYFRLIYIKYFVYFTRINAQNCYSFAKFHIKQLVEFFSCTLKKSERLESLSKAQKLKYMIKSPISFEISNPKTEFCSQSLQKPSKTSRLWFLDEASFNWSHVQISESLETCETLTNANFWILKEFEEELY